MQRRVLRLITLLLINHQYYRLLRIINVKVNVKISLFFNTKLLKKHITGSLRRILQKTQQGKCMLIVNLQNPLQKKGVFIKKVAPEQMLNAIKKVLYFSVIIAILLDNLKRQGHELDKKGSR